MVNKERGEVAFEAGGETYTLCLTLGALAEIETALGAQDIEQFVALLMKPSIRNSRAIFGALLRGGGHDMTDEDAGRIPLKHSELTPILGRAFTAAGYGEEPVVADGGTVDGGPEKN